MYRNKIIQYKIIMRNISPFRMGTGEADFFGIEMEGNKPKIPAKAIAGLFRHFLFLQKEKEVYEAVFIEPFPDGEQNKKQDAFFRRESMILIEDAIAKKDLCSAKEGLQIRQHVSINPKSGVSEEKKLYETYAIKAQRNFEVMAEIRKYERHLPADVNSVQREQTEEEDENLLQKCEKCFEAFLHEIDRQKICIGGGTNLGLGQFEIEKVQKACHDLSTPNGRQKYLHDGDWIVLEKKEDKITRELFKITATCPTGLLVRGNTQEPSQSICAYKEEHFIIPASTIKGGFRNACLRFCQTLNEKKDDISLLHKLFGCDKEEKDGKEQKAQKGQLKFFDVILIDAKSMPRTRIAIDSTTGGTVHGAFFKEELVMVEKPFQILIDISEVLPEDKKEVDIMLKWCRKEMRDRRFTIGSGQGIGYGILEVPMKED